MTTKRHKLSNAKSKTKTVKCRPSQDQLKVYCREAANTFNQFEHSFNKLETENFERELVKMFKIPLIIIHTLTTGGCHKKAKKLKRIKNTMFK
jgi:hypothetical protein